MSISWFCFVFPLIFVNCQYSFERFRKAESVSYENDAARLQSMFSLLESSNFSKHSAAVLDSGSGQLTASVIAFDKAVSVSHFFAIFFFLKKTTTSPLGKVSVFVPNVPSDPEKSKELRKRFEKNTKAVFFGAFDDLVSTAPFGFTALLFDWIPHDRMQSSATLRAVANITREFLPPWAVLSPSHARISVTLVQFALHDPTGTALSSAFDPRITHGLKGLNHRVLSEPDFSFDLRFDELRAGMSIEFEVVVRVAGRLDCLSWCFF